MLAVNGMRAFLTAGKEGVLGDSVVLIVPQDARTLYVNGVARRLNGLQLYALAEMLAAKFKQHYGYPVDIEWSEV